jgi:hypothetical protein
VRTCQTPPVPCNTTASSEFTFRRPATRLVAFSCSDFPPRSMPSDPDGALPVRIRPSSGRLHRRERHRAQVAPNDDLALPRDEEASLPSGPATCGSPLPHCHEEEIRAPLVRVASPVSSVMMSTEYENPSTPSNAAWPRVHGHCSRPTSAHPPCCDRGGCGGRRGASVRPFARHAALRVAAITERFLDDVAVMNASGSRDVRPGGA